MTDFTVIIRECSVDEGGGYRASFMDLPGCVGDGVTPDEALRHAEEAKECWLEAAQELGVDIDKDNYSGRLLLRMPKEMHRDISLLARSRDVSINSLITDMVSDSLKKASMEFRKAG